MANIISRDSGQTPMSICEGTDFSSELNCPWVQIGKLYVSVTTTGNKSWGPIVTAEYAKGVRKFAVLSGRHGDQYGQVVDIVSGAFGEEVADQSHFTQDLAEVSGLSGRLQGIEINVLNAGVAPYNKVTALRTLAASQLGAGQTVIFAWCFSIFSMHEHPKGVPDKALESYMLKACNTTVAALVQENYAWAG